VKTLDTTGAPFVPPGFGCLFGITVPPTENGVLFVDDCTNTVNLLH
jgi:hypothetical protein